MGRFRKRSFFSGMPPLRAIGFLVLMGFAPFVSFRIFTAPVKTVQILAAPDGSRDARLQYVYYSSKPGFKIQPASGTSGTRFCTCRNTPTRLPER